MSDEQNQDIRQVVIRSSSGGFGVMSLLFCIIGGIFCIGGRLSLIELKASSDNSILQAIANGIGWYCLGKGIFMIAVPFQARGAFFKLIGR